MILTQTPSLLTVLDPANPWFDWHFIFAVSASVFYFAALGLYFNFWPLNYLNRIRTDTFRSQYLSPKGQKISKALSFLAYSFGGTCFLAVWLYGVAQGYRLEFDRSSNQMTKTSIFFGDEIITHTIALSEVINADFESSKGSAKRLILNLSSDRLLIGTRSSFTDQDGIEAAKDAINRFLETKSAKKNPGVSGSTTTD